LGQADLALRSALDAQRAMLTHGWLFDVYPQGRGMTLWLLDRQGVSHQLHDRFTPSFFVHGPATELRQAWRLLRRRWPQLELARAERRDLFLDEDIEVLRVGVPVPAQLPRVLHYLAEAKPELTYYNADIPLPQRYVLARGIFPLAYCAAEHRQGQLEWVEALNSPWEVEYELPPLRVMTLRLDGELRNPGRGHRGDLLVGIENDTFNFPRRHSRQLVLGVQHLIERYDPDLLVSAYGDSYLLPRLIELADHYGLRLTLNRDPHQRVQHKRAHSYFSYGKVIFRDEQHTLFGRWHIDRQNAFLVDDYGLDGIIEIARLSGLPPQKVARASSGTSISAMQVATAMRRGVLVPWQKRQPESLKSVPEFFAADKGGLVYNPIAGLHQHVAELDFTAMYPSLMVHFNLSPETVKTDCCQGVPVPELGAPVCQHRRGLVPETLAPLLAKRAKYKELMKALPPGDPKVKIYRRRYSAHKWLLVTCFGYLGYKNARFGRIEAHEAVTAYGREVLLQAKEIIEAHGFRVLHLYVDGLWIHKPGALEQPDYESLLAEISQQVGIPIDLEGVYRWLAFLPSRTEPRVAAANRYFGAFQDGSLKMRGIESRRRDTPEYIKDTQVGMLKILAQAEDAAAFRQSLPAAIQYATDRLRRLQRGEVPSRQLVINRRLSRAPEDFRVRTVVARAATQLVRAGVELRPGEHLRYLHVPGPAVVRAWDLVQGEAHYDRQAYLELLLRAVETVLMPLGVGRQTLDTWLLAEAGYWGPPGVLPPPGADVGAPLLARSRRPGIAVVGRRARARRQWRRQLQLPSPAPARAA
jgi:DNA polymerase-2